MKNKSKFFTKYIGCGVAELAIRNEMQLLLNIRNRNTGAATAGETLVRIVLLRRARGRRRN